MLLHAFFFNSEGQLRNGWWIALFVLIVATTFGLDVLVTRRQEIGVPAQAATLFGTTWLMQRMRRRPVTEVLGRFGWASISQALAGAALGTLIVMCAAGILALAGHLKAEFVGWSFLPHWALFYAFVAIGEELLFRGFIFKRLVEGLGIWQAQTICAAIFLLAHSANPGLEGIVFLIGGLNIFAFSLLSGLLVLRSKGLAASIGLHAFSNLMQGGVLGTETSGLFGRAGVLHTIITGPTWLSGGSLGLEGGVPCFFLILLAIAGALIWSPNTNHNAESTAGCPNTG